MFEAEVRDIMEWLERNSQVMPASLQVQENIITSIAKLMNQVQAANKAVTSLSEMFTTLTKGQIRLSNQQTTLKQIILLHFRCNETANVQINATKGLWISAPNTEGPISLLEAGSLPD